MREIAWPTNGLKDHCSIAEYRGSIERIGDLEPLFYLQSQ